MILYPLDYQKRWHYGKAHHFKGPHNGIGVTVKTIVYQDVSSFKAIIKDAKDFSNYVDSL